MSESSTKAHPLLYVISALCVLNLALTGVVYLHLHKGRTLAIAPSGEQLLPRELQSNEERIVLFERLKKFYNSNDADSIYQMLDPVVQDIKKDQITKILDQGKGLTGSIIEGAYSYYEYVGTTQGIRTYRLYYRLNTEKGKATLIVLVGQQGDTPYRFLGFYINPNE